MKIYRVYYYRYYSTIAWKDVIAKDAEQAIKRAKVRNIIGLKEV